MKHSIITTLLVCSMAFASTGCGGGSGGSDDFQGSGIINGSVSPQEVDPGDRVEARAAIFEANESGIRVSIRYPEAFSYVPATAFLLINGIEFDIDPDAIINLESSDNTIITFVLPPEFLEDNNDIEVVAQFRLNDEIDDDETFEFDVDTLDLDDLNSESSDQDQIADEFNAEDENSVRSPES